MPNHLVDVTVLWAAPNGVRCVVGRYDETRYQLRLLRDRGTIKSDLFADYAQALAASREWQQHVRAVDSPDAVSPLLTRQRR
jgi:hypothetical protein